MPRFTIHDLHFLEAAPTSPANLRSKIDGMIFNSTKVRAKVELVNQETGEYRLILQGTLDKEAIEFE